MPRQDSTAVYCAEFDFDLAGAVQAQLVEAFSRLSVGKLEKGQIEFLKARQGVYQLFLDGKLVYIGKAKSLCDRLENHRHKLSGRLNIDISKLGFKGLYVHRNWTPMTHEETLIRYYRDSAHDLWNGTGFGSNDPGRNRELTQQRPDGFHMRYPINADFHCKFIESEEWTALELLKQLKIDLPFLLRFGAKAQALKDELQSATVTIDMRKRNLPSVLRAIGRALSREWQITKFASHIIMYKEERDYEYGERIWPVSR